MPIPTVRPSTPAPYPDASQLVQQANADDRTGNYLQALAIWKSILQQNPRDDRVRLAIISDLYSLQRYRDFRAFVRATEAYDRFRPSRADRLFRSKSFSKAFASYAKELRGAELSNEIDITDPNQVTVLPRGLALAQRGRYAKAINVWDEAVDWKNVPGLFFQGDAAYARGTHRAACNLWWSSVTFEGRPQSSYYLSHWQFSALEMILLYCTYGGPHD